MSLRPPSIFLILPLYKPRSVQANQQTFRVAHFHTHFSISHMSDGADNKSFTVRRALEALGEEEGQAGSLYFQARSWSNWNKSQLNGHAWTDPIVHRHLKTLYHKKMLAHHPDKGASGPENVELFIMAKGAWNMLNGCYSEIETIDLTEDSDTEDRGEGNRQAIVIRRDRRTTNQDSEGVAKEDESEEARHQQEGGGGSERDRTPNMRAGGTVQPVTGKPFSDWDHMIGETFQKDYWFKGEVTTIRVEKVKGQLVHFHSVVYDDGDKEDCSLDDLGKLRGDDDCKLVVGNVGYKFWKQFLLNGQVTRIRYRQGEKGESMTCSC